MYGDSYSLIKSLEQVADTLGFYVSRSSYDYKMLALYPKGKKEDGNESLPIYARDAQFGYGGSVEELLSYLYGWQRALEYTRQLGLTDKDKIQKKEEQYRHAHLVKVIENGKSD